MSVVNKCEGCKWFNYIAPSDCGHAKLHEDCFEADDAVCKPDNAIDNLYMEGNPSYHWTVPKEDVPEIQVGPPDGKSCLDFWLVPEVCPQKETEKPMENPTLKELTEKMSEMIKVCPKCGKRRQISAVFKDNESEEVEGWIQFCPECDHDTDVPILSAEKLDWETKKCTCKECRYFKYDEIMFCEKHKCMVSDENEVGCEEGEFAYEGQEETEMLMAFFHWAKEEGLFRDDCCFDLQHQCHTFVTQLYPKIKNKK